MSVCGLPLSRSALLLSRYPALPVSRSPGLLVTNIGYQKQAPLLPRPTTLPTRPARCPPAASRAHRGCWKNQGESQEVSVLKKYWTSSKFKASVTDPCGRRPQRRTPSKQGAGPCLGQSTFSIFSGSRSSGGPGTGQRRTTRKAHRDRPPSRGGRQYSAGGSQESVTF